MNPMKIVRTIEVPTGQIFIGQTDRGLVEFLSLADYGKEKNIKCDAMGLTRPLGRVNHSEPLPLSEKWAVTISTQYGCSMGCRFCDVPKVGPGVNISEIDMLAMVRHSVSRETVHTKRLNIHFARMGEPTFNPDVIKAARSLKDIYQKPNSMGFADTVHPVVSTMMPCYNKHLERFLSDWLEFKTASQGEAGLQLSINSTSRVERHRMFNGRALMLSEIAPLMQGLIKRHGVVGRKITLNFALAGYTIDAGYLAKLFDPRYFLIKLTPMHKTRAALSSGIETKGDYTTFEPYAETEEALKAVGFDVLVFIASKEEDESRITCGNAILSDKGLQ